jgi:hypothetical protein
MHPCTTDIRQQPEAAAISLASKRKSSVVLASSTLHPFTLEVLKTWAMGTGFSIETIPEANGVCDLGALPALLRAEVAGVILQSPNRLRLYRRLQGLIRALAPAERDAHHIQRPSFAGPSAEPGRMGCRYRHWRHPASWACECLWRTRPVAILRYVRR